MVRLYNLLHNLVRNLIPAAFFGALVLCTSVQSYGDACWPLEDIRAPIVYEIESPKGYKSLVVGAFDWNISLEMYPAPIRQAIENANEVVIEVKPLQKSDNIMLRWGPIMPDILRHHISSLSYPPPLSQYFSSKRVWAGLIKALQTDDSPLEKRPGTHDPEFVREIDGQPPFSAVLALYASEAARRETQELHDLSLQVQEYAHAHNVKTRVLLTDKDWLGFLARYSSPELIEYMLSLYEYGNEVRRAEFLVAESEDTFIAKVAQLPGDAAKLRQDIAEVLAWGISDTSQEPGRRVIFINVYNLLGPYGVLDELEVQGFKIQKLTAKSLENTNAKTAINAIKKSKRQRTPPIDKGDKSSPIKS